MEKEGHDFTDRPEPWQADKPAHILIKDFTDTEDFEVKLKESDQDYQVLTSAYTASLDKNQGTLKVYQKGASRPIIQELHPLSLSPQGTSQTLKANEDSYYFGGGIQNGRFSHKGQTIKIVNENNWVDGGVASPNPFYWTTDGYGVLRHTFKPGHYDFASSDQNQVVASHQEDRFDAFYIMGERPQDILKGYFDLTGAPIVLPAYSLYEGHLNAYNRDFWVEIAPNHPDGIYFAEVDKWYREVHPDQVSQVKGKVKIKESLSGQPKDKNYPFTASALVNRYRRHDMPLGWILVNDGYGAGYGQEDSLEGNIKNLEEFTKEAEGKGIVTGLWTESELTPDESLPALLQRDLVKEVNQASVRILKTDVAWVGPGYSFGLHGTQDAGDMMERASGGSRRFIISLDGWAGSQRNAGFWTGDQNGGEWEYIRFHIPTYIGTGLSGNPNICSDMDGIFGGGNPIINIRDYQWKTFTGMQLNMDGWGANPKGPFVFDQTTSDLNRTYLKLKSQLIPYAYTLMHQALEGDPIVRAMFIDFPKEEVNYSQAVNYQFMFGDNFLVAPVYEDVKMDQEGNDVRNHIYLPEGEKWIDYFTGQVYDGGYFLHNFEAPIWKLPLFVRAGAIIPMAKPSNNMKEFDPSYRIFEIYPFGQTSFCLIEDDGYSTDYQAGQVAKTDLTCWEKEGQVTVELGPCQGSFQGQVEKKVNQFNLNVTERPNVLQLSIDGVQQDLLEVSSLEDFEKASFAFYYDPCPNLNHYSSQDGDFYGEKWIKNPVLRIKTGPLSIRSRVKLQVNGFVYDYPASAIDQVDEVSGIGPDLALAEDGVKTNSLTLTWEDQAGALRYDLLVDDQVHLNIQEPIFTQANLQAETSYSFRVRAVLKDHMTDWSNPKTLTTAEDDFSWTVSVQEIKGDFKGKVNQPLVSLVDGKPGTYFLEPLDQEDLPGQIQLDLGRVYTIDRLAYQGPRHGGLRGVIRQFDLAYSIDGVNWHTLEDRISLEETSALQVIELDQAVQANFLALKVLETSDNEFIAGSGLYVFQVPHTKALLAGDVTGDGRVDDSDIRSFKNYAGLRRGDSDFEGYIEVADLNHNGYIDAYDIYLASGQINKGSGQNSGQIQDLAGKLRLSSDKDQVSSGETFTLSLKGKDLKGVHAVNGRLPLSSNQVTPLASMETNTNFRDTENFSRIRQHKSGDQVAYLILANYKDSPGLQGNHFLASLCLQAQADLDLDKLIARLDGTDFFLVGKDKKVKQGLTRP